MVNISARRIPSDPLIHWKGLGILCLSLMFLYLQILGFHFPDEAAATPLSPQAMADPHDDTMCMSCHLIDDAGSTFETAPIKYDVESVCMQCHDPFTRHPLNVAVDDSKLESAGMELPLILKDGKTYITCLSCHHFHGMESKRYLLRYEDYSGAGRFESLCFGCHMEDSLKGMSPHNIIESNCVLCHSKMPDSGETISRQELKEMDRRCDFCHGLVEDDHYRSIDPLADLQLDLRLQETELSIINGEYVCFSCHDSHGETGQGKKLLTDRYLALVGVSRKIDPHWKNVMCVTCHLGKPSKGESKLRLNGDVNRLCVRCHNSEIAKVFLHPVGCDPSEKVHIPEDMPLVDGKITCETCHKSSLQETGEDISVALRANSSFLRFEDMNPEEFCFRCHIKRFFSKVNVHQQLDDSGEPKNEMCSGCHFVMPEDDGDPTFTTGWDRDPKEFCLLCHRKDVYEMDHPVGPHLVEPSRDVLYTLLDAEFKIGAPLPLYDDRVTCTTCHDPHQKGVLKSHRDLQTLTGKGSVRARYREILCTGCHGFDD